MLFITPGQLARPPSTPGRPLPCDRANVGSVVSWSSGIGISGVSGSNSRTTKGADTAQSAAPAELVD